MPENLADIINALMIHVIPKARLLYNAGLFVILGSIGTVILAKDRKSKASLFIAAAAYGFAINAGIESSLFISGRSDIFGVVVGFYYALGNFIRGIVPYTLAGHTIYLFIAQKRTSVKFDRIIDAVFSQETDLTERLAKAEAETKTAEDNATLLKNYLRIISHELKTPTTTMANYADLCVLTVNKLDISKDDKIKLLKYLNRILSSAETSTEVIGGLVDYNLATNPKGKSPQKIDLMPVIEDSINATDLGKVAKVTWMNGMPPSVWASDSIKRIFVNIFSNAVRYRHPERPLKVHIWWEVTKDDCIIKIGDNGIGFPAERAALIFDMFKSAHKDNQKGNGMGMAISRGIARRYKGDVWAESESEGNGATFYVRLPLRG